MARVEPKSGVENLMEYKELVVAFAAKCGLGQPESKDGAVVFEIDGMPVGFINDPAEDAVMVVAEIGEQNPDADEACSSALLKANYLFAGTGGATLCRNPETGAFAIMRSWPLASLDADAFAAAVNNLLATAEKWKAVVEGIDEAQSAHDDQEEEVLESGPGGAGGFLRV